MPLHRSNSSRVGYTILEIVVVLTVIGILAAIAVPYIKRAKQSAVISTLENDLRVFSQEFKDFELNFSTYPPSQSTPGLYPIGMENRMSHTWKDPSVIGGTYRWVYSGGDNADDLYAYIEVTGNTSDTLRIDTDRLSEIDYDLDDGNPSTGKVQLRGLSIRYYIEQ
jgi:prepilin-type N-terminal cleavage/methylation domain-containing protein